MDLVTVYWIGFAIALVFGILATFFHFGMPSGGFWFDLIGNIVCAFIWPIYIPVIIVLFFLHLFQSPKLPDGQQKMD